MKKLFITLVFILLFLVGLSILLYPFISDYFNSLSQTRVMEQFDEDLKRLSQEDYSNLIESARDYNKRLLKNNNRFKPTQADLNEYFGSLDLMGRGVIGTLEIDVINVKLPIYLGTSAGVLQSGIGHLEGSSLPVGGPGTHCVLSGHRGLPSALLLTNMDKLFEGDTFVLNILNETLVYEIDNIVIVEPHETSWLAIDPSKDYCTLMTCTPYGINTHRLLVRGHRIFIESGEDLLARRTVMRPDAQRLSPVVGYAFAAAPVILVSYVFMLIKDKKTKGRRY